jgi:DNA repair protein RAD7
MSRRNNVRGPTSALTEFLKVIIINYRARCFFITDLLLFQSQGITPTTIAARAATRTQNQVQVEPEAGPSTAPVRRNTSNSKRSRRVRGDSAQLN